MELPQDLRNAIDLELSELSTVKLIRTASELSDRYRTDKPSGGKSFIKSKEDTAAYAAFRMPATFAAVYSSLKQAQEGLTDWKPKTLLDVGTGPGTVMWAAAEVFPGLNSMTLLEREADMISLGKKLAKQSLTKSIREADWIKTDITGEWGNSSYDIVTASYVLGELNELDRAAFIGRLWKTAKDMLIIIEPGTPAGFIRIKQARERLILLGGNSIAPCPHNNPCPLPEDDWCHFSQRVPRSRLHKQVKAGELSYEDEKFSFIAVSGMKGEAASGRILRHPMVRKGFTEFKICSPNGINNQTISRRDKDLYRNAKDLGWGSKFPPYGK